MESNNTLLNCMYEYEIHLHSVYFNVAATNESNRDTDVERTEMENDISLVCKCV